MVVTTICTSDCPTQEKDRAAKSAGEYCGRGIIEYMYSLRQAETPLAKVRSVLTGARELSAGIGLGSEYQQKSTAGCAVGICLPFFVTQNGLETGKQKADPHDKASSQFLL